MILKVLKFENGPALKYSSEPFSHCSFGHTREKIIVSYKLEKKYIKILSVTILCVRKHLYRTINLLKNM